MEINDRKEKMLEEQQNITLEKVLDAFNYTLKDINDFSKETGLDYQTLKGWERNGKVSNSGKVTLYYILKHRELELKINLDNQSNINSDDKLNKLKNILKDIIFDDKTSTSKC